MVYLFPQASDKRPAPEHGDGTRVPQGARGPLLPGSGRIRKVRQLNGRLARGSGAKEICKVTAAKDREEGMGETLTRKTATINRNLNAPDGYAGGTTGWEPLRPEEVPIGFIARNGNQCLTVCRVIGELALYHW